MPASDAKVEVNVNGAWVDATTVGDGVLSRDPITVRTGRSNWSSRTDSGSASFSMADRDGRWSPDYGSGAYFGEFRRNIPVRIGVGSGDPYLTQTGTSANLATTPNVSGSLDITGDLEMRVEFQLHRDLVDIFLAGSGEQRLLLGHHQSGTTGWRWELFNANGQIHTGFVWYDSSNAFHRYETFGLEPLPFSTLYDRTALRITLDVDDGASDSRMRFYHSDVIDGTYTQVADGDTGEGVTDIQASSDALYVSGHPGAIGVYLPLYGKTFRYRLYDGIGGTVIANPDFVAQAVGQGFFNDSTGATWTIGGGGTITDTRWRFHGELASIPTRWNIDGSDVWAPVEASGLFRRLRQGARRLESPLRRGILREATDVIQYWPCEEQGGGYITRFGAAIGTNPIIITNAVPDTGVNDAFVASEPLATLGDSIWAATVDTYTETGAWQLRWLQSVPTDFTGDDFHYMQVITTDMAWQVRYRDTGSGDLEVLCYRGGVLQWQSGWINFAATGTNWRMTLSVEQNGSNLDVLLDAEDPNTGPVGGIFDVSAVAGDAGRVITVRVNKDSNIDGWSIGHITLQSAVTPLSTLADEITAYDGETAGNRIIRLCNEEGIASRIQGNPAATEQMGPQTTSTLMALLEECAATDLGLLFEPRETVAVGYRTFEDMNNQAVMVDLDYSAGEVAGSPNLDRDDADFANDVTVDNASGTKARAVLDDGSVMSVSEPPVGAGRYDASFPVNGQDDRLPILAARRLRLSSPNEPRVSRLRLGLHYPALVADAGLLDSVLDMRLGDLLTVDNNLPVVLGSTVIRQIVQGTTDTIGHFEHFVDCLTSPAGPWLTTAAAIVDLSAAPGAVQVLLTWTEPFNDGAPVDEYDIERSTTSASTGFAALTTITPNGSYVDTAVTASVQYWYRVRAVNSAGDSDWSNVVTATPTDPTDPPAAITDLAAAADVGEVDLTWSAPSSTETITSYDIQRSTAGGTGPWVDVEIDLSPTTSYSDSGLTGGQEYWYRVRATSSEGDGPWSNIDSAVPTGGGSSFPSVTSVTETHDTSFTTSHTVNMPTLAEGETVVILGGMGGPPTNTPTGFTQMGSTTNSGATGFSYINENLTAGQASTLSGSSVTLTTSGAVKGSFQVYRIDATVGWAIGTAATGFGTGPNPPNVTAGWGSDKNLFIAYEAAGGTGANVSANPTSYTAGADGDPAAGYTVGSAWRQLEAASDDPAAFTIDDAENFVTNTIVVRGSGGGGGSGVPAPSIPAFSNVTTITAGQNVKSIIEAAAEGTHFTLAAGTHTNCENVKLKSSMHVRLATGCILEGSGKGYCFRPFNQAVTGVAIGGDPAGARPIIRNYGLGTSSQEFGAIMGRVDEPLNLYPSEPDFVYQDTDDWFIYHLDLQENSSTGIKLGSNWTVYDVEVHGHTVAGINGDRIVGGLIHTCLLYWNALSPASGASSNGANMKVTWVNADVGRTAITPIDRTKAQFIVSNCTFEALDRDGGPGDCNIGMWFDLDCQDCLVEYCSFDDHPSTSVFAEGCNDIEVKNCVVRNSDGYGNALGENFVNGALCAGESTNINFHDNTLIDCDRAMVNRMSNRSSDWYNSNNGSFVNYSWAAGPRYWILATGRGTTPAASAQSNMWTGGNTWQDNTLTNCGRVMINEGTDDGGMDTSGSTPNDLTFEGNDYSGSGSIVFYNKTNTSLNLTQWQALGYDD